LDATDKRTAGGHTSVGAMPRSYQVTPAILEPAASDTTDEGQTHWPTPSLRVSSPPAEEPFTAGRTDTVRDTDVLTEAILCAPKRIGERSAAIV
jgi:hypothetical protein